MLLKGFKNICESDNFAGIKKIGLIPVKSIKGVTFDTTDPEAVKALTLAADAVFVPYEFKEDECEFQENYKAENGVRSLEQKLIFKLGVMSPASRAATEEIASASSCGMVAAVFRPNGDIQIVGWDSKLDGERPLRLQSTTGTTGKKLADATGEEITLGRESVVKAHYYLGDGNALFTPVAQS